MTKTMKKSGKHPVGLMRVSLQTLRRRKTSFNRSRVAATTDRMIAAQIAADADTAPDVTLLPEAWKQRTRDIRADLGMTQAQLATLLHISIATIRNWEQGRTPPDGAAAALLTVLAREPKAVLRALH